MCIWFHSFRHCRRLLLVGRFRCAERISVCSVREEICASVVCACVQRVFKDKRTFCSVCIQRGECARSGVVWTISPHSSCHPLHFVLTHNSDRGAAEEKKQNFRVFLSRIQEKVAHSNSFMFRHPLCAVLREHHTTPSAIYFFFSLSFWHKVKVDWWVRTMESKNAYVRDNWGRKTFDFSWTDPVLVQNRNPCPGISCKCLKKGNFYEWSFTRDTIKSPQSINELTTVKIFLLPHFSGQIWTCTETWKSQNTSCNATEHTEPWTATCAGQWTGRWASPASRHTACPHRHMRIYARQS